MPLASPRAALLGGARAKPLADDFNRANGALGATSVGNVPWEIVSGTWSITSNRATSATSPSSRPIAVVDGRTEDVDLAVDISSGGGGDALYFRVVDASNWIRLRYYGWQTSGTSCSTCNQYYHCMWCSWIGPGSGSCDNSCGHCDGCPNTGGCRHDDCGMSSCSQGASVCGTYSCNCSNWSNDNYRVYFDKMIAGSLTSIANWSGSSSRLRVVTSSNTVRVYTGAGTTDRGVYTVNEHLSATRHGIGRAETSYTGSALDNFNLTPLAA